MLECSLDLIFTVATCGVVNVIQIDPEVLPQSVFEVQKNKPHFQSKYFIHKLFHFYDSAINIGLFNHTVNPHNISL